jgi:anti-sigma factor RsiW
MRCEDVQHNLPSYADGAIPPNERKTIEAHLRGCLACRAALTQIDPVAAVLIQSQAPLVPPGFAEQVMARARYRITRTRRMWSPVKWWRSAPAPMRGVVAAVLVLGFLGGVMMGRDASRTPGNRASAVASETDPLDGYNLDYLSDAPEGSLANSYLALVSSRDGEGR